MKVDIVTSLFIASVALSFIAKAEEPVVQPEVMIEQQEKKARSKFIRVVLTAFYIAKFKKEECTPAITDFLQAVRAKLALINENPSEIGIVFACGKLDTETMEKLQQEYLPAMKPLIEKYQQESVKPFIAVGLLMRGILVRAN